VVVLLARIVLGERLTPLQLAGSGLALGAGVLLAAGG
jgi:drug/metabolite transporter (DMT)-like permease